jgi:hypothetical protein
MDPAREDEIRGMLVVLLNGPVRERLRSRIFNDELARKDAHLAELRRLVAEVPDGRVLALAYGWRPAVEPPPELLAEAHALKLEFDRDNIIPGTAK